MNHVRVMCSDKPHQCSRPHPENISTSTNYIRTTCTHYTLEIIKDNKFDNGV